MAADAIARHDNTRAYACMGGSLSFRELGLLSDRFAQWLVHEAGVRPGDRVAIMLPNLLQYPVVALGVLKAQAVVVNVNPLYTPHELQRILIDSGANTLVVLANVAHNAAAILGHTAVRSVVLTQMGDLLGWFRGSLINLLVRHVKRLVKPHHFPQAATGLRQALRSGGMLARTRPALTATFSADSLAVLQYTGGTTGVMKAAMLSHRNLLCNVEQIANSISSSPTGVAVASTSALYLFQPGSSGPEEVWREPYDNGPARKPGQLSWGTGATPVFFGPETGYEYLTITDNASPQENILVYNATSGSLIGSVPFLTADVNSGNEDAAIAVGNSIYYPSTYGYPYPASAETGPSIPESAPFVGGMQRVDVLADGSGLITVWQSETIASAAEPRLSLFDNLIYTVGLDTATGTYSLITVDPSTGALVSNTPYGSAAGDNPLQMVSMISPSGVLYQGTERGLLRVEAIPEPSTLALGGIALAALAAWSAQQRRRMMRGRSMCIHRPALNSSNQ